MSFLFIINTFGIGVVWHPNGVLSIKKPYTKSVLQVMVGTRTYYHRGERKTYLSLGVRGGAELFTQINDHKYSIFSGIGGGMRPKADGYELWGEVFGEFTFFPNYRELPLALEIGVSMLIKEGVLFFLTLGAHFYFK